jgi:heme-degrading monooxygenase HmoA
VLSFVLFLVVLVEYPNVARADKAIAAVLFDPSSTAVNVANMYETTPTTQKDVISGIMKSSKSFFKSTPGFNNFSILKSEDGAKIITLTQWQTPESYQAFVAQPAEESAKSSKKEKKDKTAIAPTRTVVFKIDKTQAPDGVIPAVSGKATLVQFSEITPKVADDQSKLLASAENLLTSVTQMYPAPRSAVLLQGVGSADVAF